MTPFLVQLIHIILRRPSQVPLDINKQVQHNPSLIRTAETLSRHKQRLQGMNPDRLRRHRQTDAADLPAVVEHMPLCISIGRQPRCYRGPDRGGFLGSVHEEQNAGHVVALHCCCAHGNGVPYSLEGRFVCRVVIVLRGEFTPCTRV